MGAQSLPQRQRVKFSQTLRASFKEIAPKKKFIFQFIPKKTTKKTHKNSSKTRKTRNPTFLLFFVLFCLGFQSFNNGEKWKIENPS